MLLIKWYLCNILLFVSFKYFNIDASWTLDFFNYSLKSFEMSMNDREKGKANQLRFFCVNKKRDGEFSAIITELKIKALLKNEWMNGHEPSKRNWNQEKTQDSRRMW